MQFLQDLAGPIVSAEHTAQMGLIVESFFGETHRRLGEQMAALFGPSQPPPDPIGPHHIVRSDPCRN